MKEIIVFFHGIWMIPVYFTIATVIYHKFLKSKYNDNLYEIMRVKFFDDPDELFSFGWITLDISLLIFEGAIFIMIMVLKKYINVYKYGWFFDLVVVCVITIIYITLYLKRKKNNTFEINIDIINNAIEAATSREVQKTLVSARDKIIKQQQLKLVKEGIAAIDRIQESFDYADVQYDIDRLKAYMELDGESENNTVSFYNDGSVRR